MEEGMKEAEWSDPVKFKGYLANNKIMFKQSKAMLNLENCERGCDNINWDLRRGRELCLMKWCKTCSESYVFWTLWRAFECVFL